MRDWSRIPRDDTEYDPSNAGFDIPKATSGTDYVLMVNTFDRPRLQWYSRGQFKDRFLCDPLNPPRPQGVDPDQWSEQAEDRIRGSTSATVTLNEDAKTLLNRIARLWNGHEVCDVHLLADQCPTISQLSADLDNDDLKQLYYNTNLGRETLLAFGTADWFEDTTRFLKPTSVFRKRAWYDLTQKGRLLINGKDEFPNLRGDPYEGLVHRITVALACLHDQIRQRKTSSYHDWKNYTIDAIAKDQHGQSYANEILTNHNNLKLYRKTYRKMEELHTKGIKPVAIFDSRETAYKVFNHWHRKGLAELPNGPFNSEFSIKKGKEITTEAYHSNQLDWVISDWTTTWTLKQNTLGPNGPDLSREQILSFNW
ncbi:hypothetical protein [Salinibaculum salinum]|uniref:hypothetical protein n=1 Tax=Salinibaculum salinum TaxID=3131996 RepID=UPI0030ED0E0A